MKDFFRPLFSPLLLLTIGLALSMAWVLGAVPDSAPVPPEAPVTTAMGWAALLIPLATPILIAAVKQLLPKIPRVALPVAAPLIGAVLQIVLNYAGMTDADTLTGMVLGAAGVALREAVDQVKKLGGAVIAPWSIGMLMLLLLSGCLTGCVSGKGFQGLFPEKDARMRGVTLILATPWGTQTVKIDEVDTRVNPGGSNPLPALPPAAADVDGYTLLRAEKIVDGNVTEPALYQKTGDPDHVYLKALGSDMWLRLPK